MASPNISEILTTTLEHRSKVMSSQILKSTILLDRLNQKGNVKPISGGVTIREELNYQQNSNVMYYDGYEELAIAPQDVLTSAEFNWKQIACAVTISGKEQLQNSGSDAIFDLMEQRIKNAETSLYNTLSTGAYSDGTGTNGKQIGGLQSLVSDAGTGTVGGIVSSTYTWWKNKIYDFSDESVTASATTIQQAMNTAMLRCSAGSEKPDLIVADNTYGGYFWTSLQTIQRLTSSDKGSAGFRGLDFMGIDVYIDGMLGGDAPSAHMYMLNTDHIFLKPHRDRNLVPIVGDRYSTNQDAITRLIGWMGNLTTNGRRYHAALVA